MSWEEMIGNRSVDGGIFAKVLKSVTDGLDEVPRRTMYGKSIQSLFTRSN